MLRPFLASLLFILAAVGIAAFILDLPYWALTPEQKFATQWRRDLQLLEETRHFPKEWKDLSKIEFTSNDTQVQDWYSKTGSPLTTRKEGAFKLQILGVYYVEGYRYGTLLQFTIIENKTGDKVGELARTLKLGLAY